MGPGPDYRQQIATELAKRPRKTWGEWWNNTTFFKPAYESIVQAMTLPGDVYQGKVDPRSDEAIGRSFDLAGMLTLGAGAVPARGNELRAGIKAYHATRAPEFTEFQPGWRGATFFSPTKEGAEIGATAGRQDLAHLSAPTSSPNLPPRRVVQVEIPDEGIQGLHLLPVEKKWFDELPKKIDSDEELTALFRDAPGNIKSASWDTFYDERRLADGSYEYIKRSKPPSLSYEEAVRTGRDVYGRQHAHYGTTTDEPGIANRVRQRGMKGYLVSDEAGTSIAMVDPSGVTILPAIAK